MTADPTAPDGPEGLEALDPALRQVIDQLPTEPGVYLMKDRRGRVIYVGKAKGLRARVRSYFTRSGDTRAFVALLGRLLADVETVVTGSEKEALLLENHLIKQHKPRFNVKLVDDKSYLVARLDPAARWPRLEVVRRLRDDGAWYFGPYHSATSARETLRVVNRHFQLRTCTDHVLGHRRRPCLQYQIKRCPAPCVLPIDADEYAEQVREVGLFLEGKDGELLERIRARMKGAAGQLAFERAAALRDQLTAIEQTLEQQRIVSSTFVDQDVVGFHREGDALELAVLHVRQGKLLGRRGFSLRGQELPDGDVLSAFVRRYYDLGGVVPDEVLLPLELDDAAVIADWLRDRRGARVELLAPRRGPRAQLVELALKNAAATFASRRDKTRDAEAALEKLGRRLRLKRPPRRIECYDVANLQGQAIVASMVVFLDGEPARAEYRRFRIKTVQGAPDDFASLYEVLSRRFRRARAGEPGWEAPDLLVVDGGKGQLSTALAALGDVGIEISKERGFDVVGLAKARAEGEQGREEAVPDRVFLPNVKDPVRLRPNTAELYLLARIRDEAHRFANAYHRKLRGRRTLRSALDDIPGIGPKRRSELLRHLGSVKGIRAASVDELAAAPGMSRAAAAAVHAFFHAEGAGGAPAPAAEGELDANDFGGLGEQGEVAPDAAAEDDDLPDVPEEELPGGDGGAAAGG